MRKFVNHKMGKHIYILRIARHTCTENSTERQLKE